MEAPKFGFELLALFDITGIAAWATPLNKLGCAAEVGGACCALVAPTFLISSVEAVVLFLSIPRLGSLDKGADSLKLLPCPPKAPERPGAVEEAVDVGDGAGFEKNEGGPDAFNAPPKPFGAKVFGFVVFGKGALNNELLEVWGDEIAPDECPLIPENILEDVTAGAWV